MKHYNLIKSITILFFLYQIFNVIGQLGLLVIALRSANYSLDSGTGLFTGLLFLAATIAIIYFCIIKVDRILHFFKIDTLFSDNDTVGFEVQKINARWISLVFISLGIIILVPSLLDVLTQGLKKIQNGVYYNSQTITLLGELDPNRFAINVMKSIFGLLLITQSKYLGKWISKKVIEDVKIDE